MGLQPSCYGVSVLGAQIERSLVWGDRIDEKSDYLPVCVFSIDYRSWFLGAYRMRNILQFVVSKGAFRQWSLICRLRHG
ncbi:MAG: hypothetical protein ACI89U_000758 [Gammaproteobacteria bacterium]|jgi:hypothetical protein